jgi:hypothetical protein
MVKIFIIHEDKYEKTGDFTDLLHFFLLLLKIFILLEQNNILNTQFN